MSNPHSARETIEFRTVPGRSQMGTLQNGSCPQRHCLKWEIGGHRNGGIDDIFYKGGNKDRSLILIPAASTW
jgi:hypothetical protein